MDIDLLKTLDQISVWNLIAPLRFKKIVGLKHVFKIHLFEVKLVVFYLLEYGYQPLLHLLRTTLYQPR